MKRTVMCGTCGFETDAYDREQADDAHLEFDPAHEAGWYENDTLLRGEW